MGRSRSVKNVAKPNFVHAYWTAYPYFMFRGLKVARAVKQGVSRLGSGVPGFACAGRAVRSHLRNKLLRIPLYKLPLIDPLWSVSTTFKYAHSWPEGCRRWSTYIYVKTPDLIPTVSEDLSTPLVLSYDACWFEWEAVSDFDYHPARLNTASTCTLTQLAKIEEDLQLLFIYTF